MFTLIAYKPSRWESRDDNGHSSEFELNDFETIEDVSERMGALAARTKLDDEADYEFYVLKDGVICLSDGSIMPEEDYEFWRKFQEGYKARAKEKYEATRAAEKAEAERVRTASQARETEKQRKEFERLKAIFEPETTTR